MNKIIWTQFWILLLGALFAWGNFILEVIDWQSQQVCYPCTGAQCPEVSCPVLLNLFVTPCFWGAVFFTLAFILSVILVKNNK